MPHDRPPLRPYGRDTLHETLVLPKMELVPEEATQVMNGYLKQLDKVAMVKKALDLVVELWPKPGYASVTLESHQWIRLRQLLLSVPDLVAGDE